MFYKILLASLLCSGAWAQSMVLAPHCNGAATLCSTSGITESVRVLQTYPNYFGVVPSQQTIAITNGGGGTLSGTITLSGAITTAGRFGGPLLRITGQYDGTTVSSWSGDKVVKLNWNSDFFSTPTPTTGTYTGFVTFAPNVGSPVSIPITIIVLAASYGQETNVPFMGYPVGCTNNAPYTSWDANCTVALQGTLALPAINSSQTDANFGGTLKRCTPRGIGTAYGSNTAFSAHGTYFWAFDIHIGSIYIYTTANCSIYRSLGGAHGAAETIQMSGLDDNLFYYNSGSRMHQYNWVTDTDTTLGNYSGAPYSATTLTTGGTAQVTNDDWTVWYFGTLVCAVNLPQLRMDGAPGTGNTYCATLPASQATVDWTGVWAMDTVANKRFVIAQGQYSSFYYVGAPGVLSPWIVALAYPGYNDNDDSYPFTHPPQGHGYGDGFAHSAMYVDAGGNALLFNTFGEVAGGANYVATMQINKGPLMMRNREEGGGMQLTQITATSLDDQPGCADGVGCLMTFFDLSGTPATAVASITATNPPVLVTATPHGYSNGTQSIRIDGALGGTFPTCLAAAVYPSSTVTDSTHITVNGANCAGAGTYTANSANQGNAAISIPASPVPNWSETLFINPGHTVNQIMMNRTIGWVSIPGSIDSYYASARGSLNRDGTLGAINSNWGQVLDPAVFILQTGVAASTPPTITSTCPFPAGVVGVPYSFPVTATGTATITFSPTAGTLPTGLTLAANGLLSGTPSAAATYIFTITATNGIAPDAMLTNCHLTIAPGATGGMTIQGFTLKGISTH